jgi:hypothetical protein
MLLPADISTGWFISAMQSADELRLITGGRVQFVPASVTGSARATQRLAPVYLAPVHHPATHYHDRIAG